MKTSALIFSVLFLAASASAQWKYPPTKTGDASDTYFGKTYKDPYRRLENLKDKDVETWFKAQSDLTESALARIPGRKVLVDEWMVLDKLKPANYNGIGFMNGRVFYKKTRAGENVGILYYREGIKGEEKLLFDPGTYSKEQTTVVQSFLPSWDGKRVLLGLSAGGAEWSELRVLDVDSRKLLPETIYPSFDAYMWAPDSRSFLYDAGKVTDIKSLAIELNRQVRVHNLGSAIGDDVDLLSNESQPALGIAPREQPGVSIDMDSPDYVFAQVGTVQRETRLFYAPTSEIRGGKMNWKVLGKLTDNLINFVVHGDFIYAETHTAAPKYKVVRTSLTNPDWDHAETVIPEAGDAILYITKSKHFLFVVYSNGIVSRIVKYDFGSGKTSEVKLPYTGTAFISCPDWMSDLCHVEMTSWTLPVTRYDYDPQNETFAKSVFNEDVVYPGFENLVAEEVEVPSHDGVMVPLSIVHQKQMKLDGSNCCILEGYGAYGMTFPANCNLSRSVATHGVVLAFAHPRGGGEKGEAWYKAGYKATKPNTWKDFIACAEYLIKKGYTSPEKLGGTGTSAGGILISRAITERPDLFRAAICNVGCANAMRLEFMPNGPVNVPEFGTVQDEAECKALFEMDGVAHVRAGVKYPAVMGVGGWNDPRVSPWEPGKFVAALQNSTASDRPVFMKVNYDNGHFTEEKVVTFNNFASQTSFLLWQTGHKEFQPVP
jgi:prolyl oligopeptidase